MVGIGVMVGVGVTVVVGVTVGVGVTVAVGVTVVVGVTIAVGVTVDDAVTVTVGGVVTLSDRPAGSSILQPSSAGSGACGERDVCPAAPTSVGMDGDGARAAAMLMGLSSRERMTRTFRRTLKGITLPGKRRVDMTGPPWDPASGARQKVQRRSGLPCRTAGVEHSRRLAVQRLLGFLPGWMGLVRRVVAEHLLGDRACLCQTRDSRHPLYHISLTKPKTERDVPRTA
jgi:hypothetical protein